MTARQPIGSNLIGEAVQIATEVFRAGQAHPLDLARERRQAEERNARLRGMGFSESEIAIRNEPSRRWTERHPGPGMRRCLVRWPQGDLQEISLHVDHSWEWGNAKIVCFREEAA